MALDPNVVRRACGGVFLTIAVGMLALAELAWEDRLRGWGFILYWGACFLFTLLAAATALLDIAAIRRQTRDAYQANLQQSFKDLPKNAEPPSGKEE